MASAISSTQIELDWAASVDSESGIQGYDIWNVTTGQVISNVLTTSYVLNELLPNTSYSIRVRARDNAGNSSAYSPPASATTQSSGTVVNTYLIPAGNFGQVTRLFDGTNISTGFDGAPWLTTNGVNRLPQGGDIIELQAGSHIQYRLRFQSISGTQNNRIIVRGPQTGTTQAVIRRPNVAAGQFVWLLQDCNHMTIDGYLPTAGSQTTEPYQCGIKVTYALDAVAGLGTANKDGPSHWIMWGGSSSNAIVGATLKHCEIDGGWIYAAPEVDVDGRGSGFAWEGIGVKIGSTKAADGTWNDSIKLLYNWCRRTQGEGFYQGSNAYAGNIPMRNHEMAFNIVQDCGGGSTHQKVFLEGNNSVHHNIFLRCGQNAPTSSRHATTHQLSTSRVYNNWIESTGYGSTRINNGNPCGIAIYTIDSVNTPAPGEKFMGIYGPYSSQEVWVYNNVIIRGGNATLMAGADPSDGVIVGKANPDKLGHTVYIFNNTILDNFGTGISVSRADGGFIKNNIVLGNKQGQIQTIAQVPAANNITSADAQSLFVNYAADDFRLAFPEMHPAVGTIGIDISQIGFGAKRTDQLDSTRPIGSSADVGAYEG